MLQAFAAALHTYPHLWGLTGMGEIVVFVC